MNTLTKLSHYQKKTLDFYLTYRDKKLTLAGMFLFNAKLYVLTLVIFGAVIFVYYFFFGDEAASIVAAMFIGALARDIGIFRKTLKNWPLLREIIDWNKAGALMEKLEKEALEKRSGSP